MTGTNQLLRFSKMGCLAILIVSFMSACTAVPKQQTESPLQAAASKAQTWGERVRTLTAINNWQVNGKIAVHTPKNSGSAAIDWQQHNKHYFISLMAPLGSQSIKLTGEPGQVSAESSDGKQASAKSPEQLLAEQWGFNVPVSNLKYWVRGIPVPNLSARTHFDASGNKLDQLEQQGWLVQFLSYKQVQGIALPDKIFISSPAIKVRMMIYEWQIS